MPEPPVLRKAELRELDETGEQTQSRENWATVQFNPDTLKVSYSNQVVPPANSASAGDQGGTDTLQYVGKGTTKLAVTLWYDVTGIQPPRSEGQQPAQETDVQELTKKVLYYMMPQPYRGDKQKLLPPGIRFIWGTFQFDGVMESMEQTLEYFSPEGKPLRASVAINLTKQAIIATIGPGGGGASGAAPGGQPAAGTRPLSQARSGDTVQGLASSQGQGANWQSIAQANGIENPRQLQPGQFLDMSPPGISGSVGIGAP